MLPQVGILDLENRLVPVGKIGEVCIRGSNVTKGYLNRPEANKEAYGGVRLFTIHEPLQYCMLRLNSWEHVAGARLFRLDCRHLTQGLTSKPASARRCVGVHACFRILRALATPHACAACVWLWLGGICCRGGLQRVDRCDGGFAAGTGMRMC